MPKKKSGFTLIEILIVLVIVGILAGLALPSYFNTVEEARANEARVNLRVIYAAERVVRLNRGTFWSVAGNPTAAQINDINALNTDIATQFYDITFPTVANAAGFTASATRNDNQRGGGAIRTFNIDQTGTLTPP